MRLQQNPNALVSHSVVPTCNAKNVFDDVISAI